MKNFYAIITENDTSKWNDNTGTFYHFPAKYLKILRPGVRIIYYKGKQRDSTYNSKRLSKEPHYFGLADIGEITIDKNNVKNYYATIVNYIPFETPVNFRRTNGKEYEIIPTSKITNYWRDGVRPISKEVYNSIIQVVGISEENTTIETPSISITAVNPSLTNEKLLRTRKARNNNEKEVSYSIQSYFSPNAKIIGDRGEQIVLDYLKNNLENNEALSLRWLANENITPGYDIEYKDVNDDKICVEVKTTGAKLFTQFIFTINELKAAQIYMDKYIIYLVSECFSENPKIEVIANPFLQKENGELNFEPIVFKVFRQE